MPRTPLRSIFDLPDVLPPNGRTQLDHAEGINRPTNVSATESKAPHDAPFYSDASGPSQLYPTRDTDTSSIFTQSTMEPSMLEQTDRKRRFSFLKRNRYAANGGETKGLLADPKERFKPPKGKFDVFKNRPYEPTEKDLEISQRLRERLGSREEAIRSGGAQPAGYKGPSGAWMGGSPS